VCEGEQDETMFFPMGLRIMYLTSTKWLWDPHVEKLGKNRLGMGMCRIVKQIGKADPKKLGEDHNS
jgi:hypothetical protein